MLKVVFVSMILITSVGAFSQSSISVDPDDLLVARFNDLAYYLARSPDGSYSSRTAGDIYVGLGKIIGSGKMKATRFRVSYQIDCKKSVFRIMYLEDGKEYSEWKKFNKKIAAGHVAVKICG
jgi:hypothetical protein